MPVKWGDAEEKRLLLLLLNQADSKFKPDFAEIIAAWPTDPEAHGPSGIPTKDSFSKRVNSLRRDAAALAGAATGGSAAAAPGARRPASRPAKRIKQTPAKATGLLTPLTSGRTASRKKRKLSSTSVRDASMTSESEEAQSTDAGEDLANSAADPDTPTPAIKYSRTSYFRASKAQDSSYAQLDGPESSDDDNTLMAGSGAAAGAEWEKGVALRKQARKRSKVVVDDSDEDYFESELETMD